MSPAWQEVLAFWFGAPAEGVTPGRRRLWFGKDATIDALIRTRFLPLHRQAASGELDAWREAPASCLALVLLLDQFSRHLYRDTPRAFACDPQARAIAAHGLACGFDAALSPVERAFLYLPFEHSEDATDQARAVALFAAIRDLPDMRGFYDYALAHQRVIARFGRFPHRNAILGRPSTSEELAYLQEPGSGF